MSTVSVTSVSGAHEGGGGGAETQRAEGERETHRVTERERDTQREGERQSARAMLQRSAQPVPRTRRFAL